MAHCLQTKTLMEVKLYCWLAGMPECDSLKYSFGLSALAAFGRWLRSSSYKVRLYRTVEHRWHFLPWAILSLPWPLPLPLNPGFHSLGVLWPGAWNCRYCEAIHTLTLARSAEWRGSRCSGHPGMPCGPHTSQGVPRWSETSLSPGWRCPARLDSAVTPPRACPASQGKGRIKAGNPDPWIFESSVLLEYPKDWRVSWEYKLRTQAASQTGLRNACDPWQFN